VYEALDLHYEQRGEPRGSAFPVLILHGLFGSLANWRSLARRLASRRRVYSVDLRNHGRSPHARPHDCRAMAHDCAHFIRVHAGGRVALIGHSMGGRVAMYLALRHAELVERLVVIDASPKSGAAAEPRRVLDALLALQPERFEDREAVDTVLAATVADAGVRASLLMNLERRPDGGVRWRIGLEEIAESFDRLGAALPDGRYDGPGLFVRGGRSDYLPASDEPLVKAAFPAADVVTIADAGHLPHVDTPERLASVIDAFLERG